MLTVGTRDCYLVAVVAVSTLWHSCNCYNKWRALMGNLAVWYEHDKRTCLENQLCTKWLSQERGIFDASDCIVNLRSRSVLMCLHECGCAFRSVCTCLLMCFYMVMCLQKCACVPSWVWLCGSMVTCLQECAYVPSWINVAVPSGVCICAFLCAFIWLCAFRSWLCGSHNSSK